MKKLLGISVLLLMLPISAIAGQIFPFVQVTSNGNIQIASQLTVEVLGAGDSKLGKFGVTSLTNNQVLFVFRNNIGISSSATDVYFQDGTLLNIASIKESSGVDFVEPVGNLPGGVYLDPKFVITKHFSAGSGNLPTSPTLANGINASGEWAGIVFDLLNNQTLTDVINAMGNWKYSGGEFSKKNPNAPSLRIGILAQGINGNTRQGESFINKVPEPSFVLLLGIGLGVVGLAARRLK
jgi:hypothetical protein